VAIFGLAKFLYSCKLVQNNLMYTLLNMECYFREICAKFEEGKVCSLDSAGLVNCPSKHPDLCLCEVMSTCYVIMYLLPYTSFTAHYNTIAREYDDLHRYIYDLAATAALKHLNLSPDDRLVEIGGGTGELAHLLWKMAGT